MEENQTECQQGVIAGTDSRVVMDAADSRLLAHPRNQPVILEVDDQLWEAASSGKSETVQHLIAQNANPNAKDQANYPYIMAGQKSLYRMETALHKASRGGHSNVIRILLESGADINCRNEVQLLDVVDKSTILICGSGVEEANGLYKMSTLHGDGNRPEYRHSDSSNTRNSIQWSLMTYQWFLDQPGPGLYRIAGRKDFEFPFDGDWSVYQIEILPNPTTDLGASVHSPVFHDCATALHLAAQAGHLEAVRQLVVLGRANLDAKDSAHGHTPLIKASENGHIDVVRFLILEAGADVKVGDATGQNALMVAAKFGHTEVVEFLLEKGGADVKATDGYGRTALHIAAETGQSDVVRVLVLRGKANVEAQDCDRSTPLIRAAQHGQLPTLLLLIKEARAKPEARDVFGCTPLLAAADNGHSEIVLALKAEANVNIRATDRNDMDAVALAIAKGFIHCTFVLWTIDIKANDSDFKCLHDTMQKTGRFGSIAGFTWASTTGTSTVFWETIGILQDHTKGLLLVFTVAQSDRYTLVDRLLKFLQGLKSQISESSPGPTVIFNFDGTVVENASYLDAHMKKQGVGIILLVPPRSQTLIVMTYSRQSDCCENEDTTHFLNSDSDFKISVPLKEDGQNCVLTNAVRAVEMFSLSVLDISYNSHFIELQIDSIYVLVHLKEFCCKSCPKLRTVKTIHSEKIDFGKCTIRKIDFSDNHLLEAIPLQAFSETPTLKEMICTKCPLLYSPPQEICKQGGRVTMDFIREVKRDGHESRLMTLFLMGDGESGKTSVINALRSSKSKSKRILEDQRTVGIDISKWELADAEVTFKIFDLAGQAVYSKTHQLFLQRRAVYMLVWRAHPSLVFDDSDLKARVVHWMDSLQNRIPGSYMLIVVTHIDAVTADVLQRLQRQVKQMVSDRLAAMASVSKRGLPILHVLNDGESIPVNCLLGIGINELRAKLISFTKSMPWYKERLPSSWERLEQAILKLSTGKDAKNFLEWDDYARLAEDHGLQGNLMVVGTRFLHETGIIRYFGDLRSNSKVNNDILSESDKQYIRECVDERNEPGNSFTTAEIIDFYQSAFDDEPELDCSEEEIEAYVDQCKQLGVLDFSEMIIKIVSMKIASTRSRESDQELENNPGDKSRRMLQTTVFISPHFMINIMKGLIRHDRDTLLTYFMREKDKLMLRRVNRFSASGRLHLDLVPFLWPSSDSTQKFWNWVKTTQEGNLWCAGDVVSSDADRDRAVALLEGFDLLTMNAGEREIIVPGVLSGTRSWLTGDAFNKQECPFFAKFSYLALPDGAFESLIVRIAKTSSHCSYSADAAVFYKIGHMGQIFCSKDLTQTVHLFLTSSSKNILQLMQSEVQRMEDFFPGLVRMSLDKSENMDEIVEPSQVVILADQPDIALQIEKLMKNADGHKSITTALQLPDMSYFETILVLSEKEREDYVYHVNRLEPRFSHTYRRSGPSTDRRVAESDGSDEDDGEQIEDTRRSSSGSDTEPEWDSQILKEVLEELKFKVDEADIDRLLENQSRNLDFSSTLMFLIRKLTFQAKSQKLLQSMEGARVVLVCLNKSISSCTASLSQFEEHLKARRAVIPVIMDGFDIRPFPCWWPQSMPGLENHKLYVDMRKPDQQADLQEDLQDDNQQAGKMKRELLPQILKFLSEWRARPCENQVPFPSTLDPEFSTNEQIECLGCLNAGVEPQDVMCWERSEVRTLFDNYLAKRNKGKHVDNSERTKTCSVCGFCNDLHDLLTVSKIADAAPCPSCLRICKFPPGAFSIRNCRLQFNESDTQRLGAVSCSTCGEQLRIMDIAPPEVFASYNWGAKLGDGQASFSTQAMVLPLMKRIELLADVACWVDVQGGMGAGDDHLLEMARGVQLAKVVILFLSDAYVNSHNCLLEFLSAQKECKFLIPVLVPCTDLVVKGHSTGWTGPGPDDPDWWKHAHTISNGVRKPDDTDGEVDWGALRIYSPIPLHDMDSAADEIVRRIMSRLHRPTKLNSNTLIAQRRMTSALTWRHLANLLNDEADGVEVGQPYSRKETHGPPQPSSSPGFAGGVANAERAWGGKEIRQRICAAFDLLDLDGSDQLERGELLAALRALGVRAEDADVARLLDRADLDRSGTISVQEFTTLFEQGVDDQGRPGWAERAFWGLVDGDPSGAITLDSLRRVCLRFGRAHSAGPGTSSLPRSENDLQAVLAVADRSERGLVDRADLEEVLALTAFSLA